MILTNILILFVPFSYSQYWGEMGKFTYLALVLILNGIWGKPNGICVAFSCMISFSQVISGSVWVTTVLVLRWRLRGLRQLPSRFITSLAMKMERIVSIRPNTPILRITFNMLNTVLRQIRRTRLL